MAMLSLDRIIFAILLFLFVIALLASLTSLYFQLREMRREVAQGKQVRWYKRPTFLLCIGMPLLIAGELINMAIAIHILPESLLFYILIALLLVVSFLLIIYSFKLSWGQIKSRL